MKKIGMVRDESSDGKFTETLNYLIRILSKANSAREWQFILAKVLTEKHGCKKVRIQTLDLAQNPADIFKSDKIFNK